MQICYRIIHTISNFEVISISVVFPLMLRLYPDQLYLFAKCFDNTLVDADLTVCNNNYLVYWFIIHIHCSFCIYNLSIVVRIRILSYRRL